MGFFRNVKTRFVRAGRVVASPLKSRHNLPSPGTIYEGGPLPGKRDKSRRDNDPAQGQAREGQGPDPSRRNGPAALAPSGPPGPPSEQLAVIAAAPLAPLLSQEVEHVVTPDLDKAEWPQLSEMSDAVASVGCQLYHLLAHLRSRTRDPWGPRLDSLVAQLTSLLLWIDGVLRDKVHAMVQERRRVRHPAAGPVLFATPPPRRPLGLAPSSAAGAAAPVQPQVPVHLQPVQSLEPSAVSIVGAGAAPSLRLPESPQEAPAAGTGLRTESRLPALDTRGEEYYDAVDSEGPADLAAQGLTPRRASLPMHPVTTLTTAHHVHPAVLQMVPAPAAPVAPTAPTVPSAVAPLATLLAAAPQAQPAAGPGASQSYMDEADEGWATPLYRKFREVGDAIPEPVKARLEAFVTAVIEYGEWAAEKVGLGPSDTYPPRRPHRIMDSTTTRGNAPAPPIYAELNGMPATPAGLISGALPSDIGPDGARRPSFPSVDRAFVVLLAPGTGPGLQPGWRRSVADSLAQVQAAVNERVPGEWREHGEEMGARLQDVLVGLAAQLWGYLKGLYHAGLASMGSWAEAIPRAITGTASQPYRHWAESYESQEPEPKPDDTHPRGPIITQRAGAAAGQVPAAAAAAALRLPSPVPTAQATLVRGPTPQQVAAAAVNNWDFPVYDASEPSSAEASQLVGHFEGSSQRAAGSGPGGQVAALLVTEPSPSAFGPGHAAAAPTALPAPMQAQAPLSILATGLQSAAKAHQRLGVGSSTAKGVEPGTLDAPSPVHGHVVEGGVPREEAGPARALLLESNRVMQAALGDLKAPDSGARTLASLVEAARSPGSPAAMEAQLQAKSGGGIKGGPGSEGVTFMSMPSGPKTVAGGRGVAGLVPTGEPAGVVYR